MSWKLNSSVGCDKRAVGEPGEIPEWGRDVVIPTDVARLDPQVVPDA